MGGVWSAARSYPGISTQDDRHSYSFTDFPMPDTYPDHPSGALVRRYLEHYAAHHGLTEVLRLNTEVTLVDRRTDHDGWSVTSVGPCGTTVDEVDWIIAANGLFCLPHLPTWPGAEDFRRAGGSVLAPSELGEGAALIDRHVVVVGWGKTSLDVAAAGAPLATSTTVVARAIRWKHPKRIGSRLTFQHLLLTRVGELFLDGSFRTFPGRALVFATRPARRWADRWLAATVARQLNLEALGLLPTTPYSDSNALVSEGFFEGVSDATIAVRRGRSIVTLGSDAGMPAVTLDDGSRLRADVVVAATGYEQSLAFLSPAVRAGLLDSDGRLHLRRKILHDSMANIAFIGWSHTFHSPASSEIAAIWLAHHLLGGQNQTRARRGPDTSEFLLTHERAQIHGSAQIPSATFGDIDQMLADMGQQLTLRTWFSQLVGPFDPADYAHLLPAVQKTVRAAETELVDDVR